MTPQSNKPPLKSGYRTLEGQLASAGIFAALAAAISKADPTVPLVLATVIIVCYMVTRAAVKISNNGKRLTGRDVADTVQPEK